jgi:hypothetical protein
MALPQTRSLCSIFGFAPHAVTFTPYNTMKIWESRLVTSSDGSQPVNRVSLSRQHELQGLLKGKAVRVKMFSRVSGMIFSSW